MRRALSVMGIVMSVVFASGVVSSPPNQGALIARADTLRPPVPPTPAVQPIATETVKPKEPYVPPPVVDDLADGIHGSTGYARAGGNCVNEPGVKNPRRGNPINWLPASQQQGIGKTVLFYWNHVAVETGYRVQGRIVVSVFVRHQNCPCPTEYPLGMIRGWI